MLLVVSIIHLLPLSGVLGGERLAVLYGTSLDDPNSAILMRHRAVLFGIIGLYLMRAAFQKAWQPSAFVIAFVSVVSFIGLAWSTGGYNAEIGRVIAVDIVALVCLVIGAGAYIYERHRKA